MSDYTIRTLDDKAIIILTGLFEKLNLVKTKSPLVTFSKTLHFFLPNLVVPIDRRYTCDFFKIYPNRINGKEREVQLVDFFNLQKAFMRTYKKNCVNGYTTIRSKYGLFKRTSG